MIKLDYEVRLSYEVDGPHGADFVFNIHPAQTPCQTVERERLTLNQAVVPEVATDPATASRFMRVHANPGVLEVRYEALVRIEHHKADPDRLQEVPVRSMPLEVMQYVYPSRYCQSDRLLRFAFNAFGGLRQGHGRVRAIQDWVQRNVTFTSNTTTGTTSAVDTLLEQVGVCRDFTHLMIALCRAVNIPARIVTGTDYGADPVLGPPDFHAYVEAYLGDRWYLFDAAGTGIPMGFLRLGTGRDAADVAFATMFGPVRSSAPVVRVEPIAGPDLEWPHLCAEALSTTPPLAWRGDGLTSPSGWTAPWGAARQLPD